MFVRRISIQRIDSTGTAHPCPIRWIEISTTAVIEDAEAGANLVAVFKK